ncbi:MAG: 3-oxoacyl-[acyl-carrier-protein] reductase [Rickettsiales bacterium]|jgi:3-oxoacyl-[acyl-carrier protein] reductase|nr:3-oxoacyl-[acyl-carrier-protein] reductase [Rickettsiales bacterium]
MFSLNGKKVLITGATGGIGFSLAETFARLGAFVGLTGRNEAKLIELKSKIQNSIVFPVDLGDLNNIGNFINDADAKIGGIDILICNAGITKDNISIRMKLEDFEEVIKVNLTASFVLNREASIKMMKRKFGRVINISSIVGVIGNAGQANYVASKAGIIGMTKTFAQEFANRGITFNCIAPGFIRTPMTDVLTDEQKNAMLSKIPQGRFGEASDIANVAAFLASDEAGYITGQTIHVNGGMAMV